jgi:hypothetical protein
MGPLKLYNPPIQNGMAQTHTPGALPGYAVGGNIDFNNSGMAPSPQQNFNPYIDNPGLSNQWGDMSPEDKYYFDQLDQMEPEGPGMIQDDNGFWQEQSNSGVPQPPTAMQQFNNMSAWDKLSAFGAKQDAYQGMANENNQFAANNTPSYGASFNTGRYF